MYLTYAEYVTMGGTLTEQEFNPLCMEAETQLNYVTFRRLVNDTVIPQEVKNCVFQLIPLIQKSQEAMATSTDGTGQAIASQSNDGVSISYNSLSAADLKKAAEDGINNTIKKYLDGVMNEAGRKVLYLGVYPGE